MLLVVVLLAVAVLSRSRKVVLEVAGQAETVRTYAGTVAGLLERRDVAVGDDDRIRPPGPTPLDDVERVEVVRNVGFSIWGADGGVRHLSAPVETVAGALEAAGTRLPSGAEVSPPRSAGVRDGTRIRIRPPRRVTLVRGGEEARSLTTTAATVGGALESAGVRLGPLETAVPGPDTRLERGGNRVRLRRASFRTVTRTVRVDPPERHRETAELIRGRTRVVQSGEPGRAREVHRLTYVGGRLSERTLVSRTVLSQPTPRIVAVGTREPPSPGDDTIWYRLAACETDGRWHIDALYDGGLQFDPETWSHNKPAGYPDYAYEATPAQQIAVARIVQRRFGWEPWNACARQLGLL